MRRLLNGWYEIKKKLKQQLKKQIYNPSWWGVFFNPYFITRYFLIRGLRVLTERVARDGVSRWLDVGCGERPYEFLFYVKEYIGIDVEESGHSPAAKFYDLLYDGRNIPFTRDYFDGVICTQVLEHVLHDEALLEEMARVLKPKGYLLLTAPFFWEEHEQPYDFTRFTRFGLEELITRSGFEIMEHHQTAGYLGALAQMVSSYLYGLAARRNNLWNMIVTALLCAPVQILGLFFQKLLPRNNNLYLDHIVLARKFNERKGLSENV